MNEERSIDIIREVINIGIGDAAAALSELVKSQVTITIPDIRIMRTSDVPGYIEKEMGTLGVYISQDFHGLIKGKTLLFYTKDCSISLLGRLYGVPVRTESLTEVGIATLQEVGNIIMVSCISTISDMIEGNIRFTIPHVTVEVSNGYFYNLVEGLEELDRAIVVKNEIGIKGENISGYLFVLIGFDDFELVIKRLDKTTN